MKNAILLTIAIAVFTMLAPGGTARATVFIPADDMFWETQQSPDSWVWFNDAPGSELAPIPPGFFGPGCAGFNGQVPLVGNPFDPPNLGTTDTAVHRGDADFSGGPFVQNIAIQMVQLSLVGVVPINVVCPGGTQQWELDISFDGVSPAAGTMNVFRADLNGGQFDIDSNSCLALRFERTTGGDVRTMFPCQDGQPPVSQEANFQDWAYGCPPDIVCGPSNVVLPANPFYTLAGPNFSQQLASAAAPVAAPEPGILIVKKETDLLLSTELFNFTPDITDPGGNPIPGSGPFNLSHGQEHPIVGIPPDTTFTVTEDVTQGFVLDLWECRDSQGTLIFAGSDPEAFFQVDSGETLTCTFFNKADTDNDGVPDFADDCADTPSNEIPDANGCSPSQLPTTGSIAITKETDPTGSPGTFDFNITDSDFNVDPFTLIAGGLHVFVNISTGNYSVTELQTTEGFVFDRWECDGPSGIISGSIPTAFFQVVSGQVTVCTFFNDKDSDNDGVPDFRDNCPNTLPGSTVDANGCSPSQEPEPGVVIINEQTNPPGSPGVFPFTQGVDASGPFDLSHGGTKSFVDVPPGPYNVTQGDIDGFALDAWDCVSPSGNTGGTNPTAGFQVRPNETTTCTFFNDVDSDNDGVGDPDDLCPGTPPGVVVDASGCGPDRIAVGGVTSFLADGSSSSAGTIALFASAVVVIAAGGWYTRRRWLGIHS